ncbi:hypothetical protein QCA50_004205 [Cerrena zonata]|uniref:Heterokaryon incompatibility domain-containing protein n=1 Tax=Cerrena zonata TaxID=2478898 RepID=A0AAW0GTI5_9APHY
MGSFSNSVPSKSHSARRFVFNDTPWLGGKHDGYPVVTLDEYLDLRLKNAENIKDKTATQRKHQVALIQSLFTFGLIEAIVEENVSEQSLLRVNNGKTYLTDEGLYDIVFAWRDRVRILKDEELNRSWGDRVCNTLATMHHMLFSEIAEWPRSSLRALLPKDDLLSIIFSFGAIAETLTIAANGLFPQGSSLDNQGFSCSFVQVLFAHRAQEIFPQGWCPFVIKIISGISLCTFGYASTREAFLRNDFEDHTKCTDRACVANNIDISTYQNKHASASCTCSYGVPPVQAIYNMLANGQIPVISCDPTTLEMVVHPSTEIPYVAISHVWADRLGSISERGLPICQLKELFKKTYCLLPGGAFWMDSLCVPEARELRKKAIGMMAETYRNASVTLVVDAGIRACSCHARLAEKLLRIVTSGWMQRLWTLQEALLAQHLVFEFQDGFESIKELIPTGDDVFDSVILHLSSEVVQLIQYRWPLDEKRGFSLVDIASHLIWRSTSKAGDETLAIAGLVGVDVAELVQLPPEERMKVFLLRVGTLPANIVFLTGLKQTERGFRWAPRTMMQARESPVAGYRGDAICTPNGLLAEYACVVFKTVVLEASIRHYFLVDAISQCIYRVKDAAGAELGCAFNAFLMDQLPEIHQSIPCAAVELTRNDSNPEDNDKDRVICEVRKIFWISTVTPEIARHEYSIAETTALKLSVKSGRVKVRIV